MNQTPPISPVVKLKLKEIDDKKLLADNVLNKASNRLQTLLNGEEHKTEVAADNDGKPITLTVSSEADSITDRLSELISQLIPLHKATVSTTLSADSISQIISLLNLTITFLQNQENALNLLKLNYGISKEQSDIEKELLIKELTVMRSIQDKQRNEYKRRYSEPQMTSSGRIKKRRLRAGNDSRQYHSQAVESDRTISDIDEAESPKRAVKDNTVKITNNRLQREEEYDKLMEEINKNQKLFLHNKFGYYYNTLNEEKGSARAKRNAAVRK